MMDWTPLFREASRLAGPNGQAGVIGPRGETVHVTSRWTATTWDDLDEANWRLSAPVYLPPLTPEDPFKAEIDRRVFWQQPFAEALNKLEAMEPEEARTMLGVA